MNGSVSSPLPPPKSYVKALNPTVTGSRAFREAAELSEVQGWT